MLSPLETLIINPGAALPLDLRNVRFFDVVAFDLRQLGLFFGVFIHGLDHPSL